MRIEIYGSAEEMTKFFIGLTSETFELALAEHNADRSDEDVGKCEG